MLGLACAVQDAGAMEKLLFLVVTSSSDEDYGEACWALLAAIARFMRTAETPRQVLYLAEVARNEKLDMLAAPEKQAPSGGLVKFAVTMCRCFVRLQREQKSWQMQPLSTQK